MTCAQSRSIIPPLFLTDYLPGLCLTHSVSLQKNIGGALWVLKQMEDADVKPDSQTFSYLLGNCSSEDDINKVHNDRLRSVFFSVTS